MAFLTNEELLDLNFHSLGQNVLISTCAKLYESELMSIGDNSRVDDFCVLSGDITIGYNVHIAIQTNIAAGKTTIKIGDYSGLAYGVQIIGQVDDYSGVTLSNPTVSSTYKHTISKPISIGRHVKIGTHSIVLPGTTIGNLCAISARSTVSGNLTERGLYRGDPAIRIAELSDRLLDLELEFES